MNSDGALCVFDVKTKELKEILDNTTFVSRSFYSKHLCDFYKDIKISPIF